jgi:hypothetical protein
VCGQVLFFGGCELMRLTVLAILFTSTSTPVWAETAAELTQKWGCCI